MPHFLIRMKNILPLLFMLINYGLIAQHSPTKVIFSYYRGGNSWGVPGIYGRGENIEITAVNPTTYKITKYYKIVNSIAKDSVTTVRDTTNFKTSKSRPIKKNTIDLLLTLLNTNRDNFNSDFIKPKLKKPTKKEILALAAKIDRTYLFEDDDPSETRETIEKIQNFDKIDSFVNRHHPDINWITVFGSDYNESLRISIVTAGQTERYICSFQELLGQPFTKMGENSKDEKRVINLQINTTVANLLPNNSLLKKIIDINHFTESYAEWYINEIL